MDLQSLVREQLELRKRIVLGDLDVGGIEFVGGVDVSYTGELATGVLVVLDSSLREVAVFSAERFVEFPYVPGLLAFREVPVLVECFEKAKQACVRVDLIFVDGQGIAHPRGVGVASHLGVLLNVPTIGVAKRRLYGTCREPEVGEAEPLVDPGGEMIGYCYRSKANTSPIYISPGHLCSLEDALSLTKKYLRGHRLPEPLRLAHRYTQVLKNSKNTEDRSER